MVKNTEFGEYVESPANGSHPAIDLLKSKIGSGFALFVELGGDVSPGLSACRTDGTKNAMQRQGSAMVFGFVAMERSMDKFLSGKTALITGGSRGLGRAVAEAYAALGALVAINYANNDAAANETRKAIEANGGEAFLIKSPQGSYEAAEDLATALDAGLLARTGSTGLDILVNNAGGGPVHHIDDTTPEIFEKVLGDNLRGPFYVTKLLKPRLREGGRVIFLSSLGARNALPQYVVYALSKRAIETFSVVMAKELGPRNITVNCISPGIIASDANADIRADEEASAKFAQMTALKRLGVPSDLAGVAVALASPLMGYVTGQLIEVSGGMSL